MQVTFLGTGTSTGIPMIGCECDICTSDDPRNNRTRCSVFIEVNGIRIVIDTGPDFRLQMLREHFDDVDAVLFTHPHKDHMAGLDDIRPVNYLKKKRIDVYANKLTGDRLKKEYPYLFDGAYPGVPLINLVEIGVGAFEVNGIKVIPIPAKHGDMDVLGFRIGDFTYLTDANYISDESIDLIRGSRVFVINALRLKSHYSHFTLPEALEIIKKVGANTSYLTHLSHMMGLHAKVEKEMPENVLLSYDGLKVTL